MSKRSHRKRKSVPTELHTATITGISHEGRGIAHIDGKTTFLFGGLPGETVRFAYKQCRSKRDEGDVVEVLTPSPDRVVPRCQHFGVCGGCRLQHMSSSAQRRYKQATLIELFWHQAQCKPEEIIEPLFDEAYGYRRRARLSAKFVIKKNAVFVGFRERNSSFVVDIHQCETLDPIVGKKIKVIAQCIELLSAKFDIPQIEVVIADNATALVVRHMVALTESDSEKLISLASENHWQLYYQPGDYQTIHPVFPENPDLLFYEIPDEKLKMVFEPAQFTQINQPMNLKMIKQAMECLDLKSTDQVLDLFCGIGNFSLPMARHAHHVTGVEGAQNSIIQAQKNAAFNHIQNTTFYTQNLAQDCQALCWAQKQYDKILLDPPRTGAAEMMPLFCVWQPERIVYISCNPITLARDAKDLLQLGYSLKKTGVMDMFPHTDHVEAIALFQR